MSVPAVFTEEDYAALADLVSAVSRMPMRAGEDPAATRAQFEAAVRNRSIESFVETLAQGVPVAYHRGEKLSDIYKGLMRGGNEVLDALFETFPKDVARVRRAAAAYRKFADLLAAEVGETYAALEAAAVEEESRKAIRELSTPVIEVWDDVLVMPLVGTIDSRRAQQITEALLDKVSLLGTRVVILDVTGVSAMDTGVANHLLDITQAARLLGALPIMVGISPTVAQTLVKLQVNLSNLETFATLRSGLMRALHSLGYAIEKAPV